MPETSLDIARSAGPAKRSRFVTVLAWIFICLSGFALFISIIQNIMISVLPFDAMHAEMHTPQFEQHVPPLFRLLFANMFLFFRAFLVITALALTSSIGLLLRKNWARLAFIAMMALGIVWNLAGLVLQRAMLSEMPSFMQGVPVEAAGGFHVMIVVIQVVSVLMVIAFCVLFGWIIRRLTSPAVRLEFGAAREERRVGQR